MGGMACHFGFPPLFLEAVEGNLHGKSDHERAVIVVFDEMSVQANVDFNTESLAFDGFVRLEDDYVINRSAVRTGQQDDPDLVQEPKLKGDVTEKDLADHALVFTVRSLWSRWIQPFGVFASRGAAPAPDLHRLLMAAIIKLQTHGAIVMAVVCDGAQSNKGLWKLADIGINVKDGRISNSIMNPTFDNRRIFFLQDPPHIIKCIRNQMFSHHILQV